MLKRFLVFALFLTPMARAAQPATPDTIHLDAVSIRENQSGAEPGFLSISPDGDRIIVRNTPMFRIVGFAFNKQRNDLIDGLPAWAREARWDIEATVAEESLPAFKQMPFDRKRDILQQILKDRCGLVAHTGKKEVPVYALTVSRPGLKIREVPADRPDAKSTDWNLTQSPGKIEGKAIPMEALLYALSKAGLERQVVDRTGLTGRYDISLTWTPDDALMGSQAGDDASKTSIFTAVKEELGLRLEATKADVDAVIVTRIEKPSAN